MRPEACRLAPPGARSWGRRTSGPRWGPSPRCRRSWAWPATQRFCSCLGLAGCPSPPPAHSSSRRSTIRASTLCPCATHTIPVGWGKKKREREWCVHCKMVGFSVSRSPCLPVSLPLEKQRQRQRGRGAEGQRDRERQGDREPERQRETDVSLCLSVSLSISLPDALRTDARRSCRAAGTL